MKPNRKVNILVPNEKLIKVIKNSDTKSYDFLYPTCDPNTQTKREYKKDELIKELENCFAIRICGNHNGELYLFIWYLGQMVEANEKYLNDNNLL